MAIPTSDPLAPPGACPQQGWTPLLDAMPQGVMLVDAKGRYLEVNPAAAQILGMDRQSLLSRGLPEPWSILSAADGTAFPVEAFPGRVALRDATPVRRKILGWGQTDGSTRWLEMSAEPLRGGGALLTFEDITAAVLARKNEERFRLAMEATSDGIWDWDVAAGEIFFNPAYSAMLGYEPHALPKRVEAWKERIFPEDQARVVALIENCITGLGQTFEVEHRVITADGGIKWVIGRGQAVSRDERGRALRMAGTILDITKRKQAEEALRVSEKKLANIFQLSPDAIDLVDTTDRVCLDFNQAYTNLFGFTRAEFIGKPLLPAELDPWVKLEDRDRLMARLREKGTVLGFETPLRRKDGTIFTAEISVSALEIEGRPCHLSLTRNVTERKLAEQERLKLKEQLVQAQKLEALGVLAGGVAHDMNNVLAAILGLASASVVAHFPGTSDHAAFDTIAQAAVRGRKMVRSLLNFAHQTVVEERELDLNTILREEVRFLERTTLSRVRLVMDLAEALRPVHGDATALTNALMNLCVNAVDAMAESGTLTLRTRNHGTEWIEIKVEDTGCGMPAEVLQKALDPFFTTKAPGKGTGLGLSMVYSTVKRHRGKLELHSEPGRGTCVTILLPATVPAPAPAAPPVEPPAQAPPRCLEVLLIDDDELIQSSMQAILAVLGHKVMAATSGEEALEKLQAGSRPDVVILDMNMPGLGGAGTLPRLRALLPKVPVLLATGRVDQAALDLTRAHPKVTLLPKPFSVKELQQKLEVPGQS